jgi:hypothetical protein
VTEMTVSAVFDELLDREPVLDELRAAVTRYVVLPSAEAADAVTLYIAATHAQPAWEHATRLVVTSPLKRCGKTRLQEIIAETAHNVLRTTNISPAALVRSIDEKDPPTIVLDEADAVFATRRGERSEGAEDLRGLLNSGHSRGWPYIRWDAAARRREECPTYAMAVLGGIGELPDTIEDRAVIIRMRRRAPGERVAQWRHRRAVPPLRELRERLHTWVLDHLDELSGAEPELPAADRAADVWEPLVAVADAAGGDWPERARRACITLTGQAGGDGDEASTGERLLADLHAVWHGEHCLYTTTIIDRLCGIDESPWPEWHRGASGRVPISPRALAALLRPYGIHTTDVREGGTGAQRKGLYRHDLTDAWSRYTIQARSGDIRDTATDDGEVATIPGLDAVADTAKPSATPSATAPETEDHWPSDGPVAAVAAVADGRLDGAIEASRQADTSGTLPLSRTCVDCPTPVPSGHVRCVECYAATVARERRTYGGAAS